MDIEVLMSTMNQKNINDLNLKDKNINENILIINQTNNNDTYQCKDKNIRMYNYDEIGLSKSRNRALENAKGDICVIADDDLVYCNNYKEIILENFKSNPNIDILAFKVEGIEKKYKDYKNKTYKIGYLNSMKVSSVEIAFRLDSILDHNLQFNELFGAGALFKGGEENIFLIDCLKKGLNIKFIPKKIADLHIGNSTWFDGYNKEYFIGKGASFTAMSKKMSFLFILQFVFRKYNMYKETTSLFDAIKYMLIGRKKFLQLKNK